MKQGDESPPLDRAQRRLLKRLYNGRQTPVVAAGKPFLTYREASTYLLSLPVEERDGIYAEMKNHARPEIS